MATLAEDSTFSAAGSPHPPLSSEDLSVKSDTQLSEILQRTQRLLSQPLVLARLPGKEDELRQRLILCQGIIAERQASKAKSSREELFSGSSNAVAVGSQRLPGAPHQGDVEFQYAMGEKYRTYRPDVETELRKSCATLLNESEIAKRLADIPNPSTYLMSYEETMAMERESVARERKRELQRIKQRREQLLQLQQQQHARNTSSHILNEVPPQIIKQVFGDEE